jgi:hypothetical protein
VHEVPDGISAANVAGAGIKMDCGDAGHILLATRRDDLSRIATGVLSASRGRMRSETRWAVSAVNLLLRPLVIPPPAKSKPTAQKDALSLMADHRNCSNRHSYSGERFVLLVIAPRVGRPPSRCFL